MRDLNDVLDLTLRLPIGGKVYEVQPPPAAIGAHLLNRLAMGLYANAGLPMDQVDEEARGLIEVADEDLPDFARMCLGDTYDAMVADDLDSVRLEFAVTTAFYAWTVGKPFAEHYWETGGKVVGSAEGPERPTATPTPEAEASSTPSPASPNGTKRRRKGSRSSSSGAATATPSSRTSTPSTASTSTSATP